MLILENHAVFSTKRAETIVSRVASELKPEGGGKRCHRPYLADGHQHSMDARMTAQDTTPRMILVDDNIRHTGGHYFELATLILSGAQQLGYRVVLAPNREFTEQSAVDPSWQLIPTFRTRRLVDWSLGVDGRSTTRRDLRGKPIGGTSVQNLWRRLKEQTQRPTRRPATMLRTWASDLVGLLQEVKPTSSDVLLLNTADDFALLALTAAMKRAKCPPLRIDAIFHFAVTQASQPGAARRSRLFGRQVNGCVKLLHPHQVCVHATTDSLAKQMRQAEIKAVTSIPYPTRPCAIRKPGDSAIKAVLAGLPRREKGREAISDLLSAMEKSLLRSDRFQVSMQMPASGWQGMVPRSLHRTYLQARQGKQNGPLEVMTAELSTEEYHRWLDTADIGLFLYTPERYVARCSGVLLELMARGVPVIVPDRCWLADQVRAAGGHRSIGLIYQNPSEIPSLLEQFASRRDEITQRAQQHASVISTRHRATNTLRVMGLADFIRIKQVA